MPFPIEPDPDSYDERGLFLVQDPELRSRILPVFTFNPQEPERRPVGQGTVFRLDPWGGCATAFHVIEDMLDIDETGEKVMLLPDNRLVGLEMTGIAYGHVPIPADAWRPLVGMNAKCVIESQPFQPRQIRNVSELESVTICPSGDERLPTPFLTTDLTHWHPKIGEKVMALGFAGLDVDKGGLGDERPMHQYIYGSIGRIIDVEPADGDRRSPWPMIRVSTEWPGGMSGGPVFNEAGQVIGVVSAGIVGQGVATATYFSGWDIPERTLSTIDPYNPGWFRCFGAFDHMGQLKSIGATEEQLSRLSFDNENCEFRPISHRFGTEDFMSRTIDDEQHDDLTFSKPLHSR